MSPTTLSSKVTGSSCTVVVAVVIKIGSSIDFHAGLLVTPKVVMTLKDIVFRKTITM